MDRASESAAVPPWCRRVLCGLAALLAWGTLQFFFRPGATVAQLNALGAALGGFTPLPVPRGRFWPLIATGYMVLVTVLAAGGAAAPRERRDFIGLLALGKAVTAGGAALLYAVDRPAFAYVATVAVDGSMMLAALAVFITVGRAAAGPAAGGRRGPSRRLDALVEAFAPAGGPFPEGGLDLGIARDVEAFVLGLGPGARRLWAVALWALDVLPCLVPPWAAPLSRQPLAERIHWLERFERTRLVPLRQGLALVKLLVVSEFYGREAVEARLGYVRPLVRVPREEAK